MTCLPLVCSLIHQLPAISDVKQQALVATVIVALTRTLYLGPWRPHRPSARRLYAPTGAGTHHLPLPVTFFKEFLAATLTSLATAQTLTGADNEAYEILARIATTSSGARFLIVESLLTTLSASSKRDGTDRAICTLFMVSFYIHSAA